MDYQGNSKNKKEGAENKVAVPAKNIEKVVVTDVIVKKKGLGRKFRDLFIEADIKSSSRYVVMHVLVPAARDMIVDATTKGMERLVYGETAIRRRNINQGPRVTYNSPVNRTGFGGSPLHSAPPQRPGAGTSRHIRNDLILSTKDEADLVLEKMIDIIDSYDVVSVSDLNELVGLPSSHVDNKWGWSDLRGTQVRQIREGYLIDFPPPEPIA